jgi:hypothetical protein
MATATMDGQDIRGEADGHCEAWRAVAELVAEHVEW